MATWAFFYVGDGRLKRKDVMPELNDILKPDVLPELNVLPEINDILETDVISKLDVMPDLIRHLSLRRIIRERHHFVVVSF